MKKPITPQNNTAPKKQTKSVNKKDKTLVPRLQEYYGLLYFDSYAMTQSVAEAMAEEIFNWCCNDPKNALSITEFCRMRGIPPSQLTRWCKKFPILRKACDLAKQLIGNNREMGMIKKQLAEKSVLLSMPMYSKKWKELREWDAQLKQKEEELNKQSTINVIMPEVTKENK